MTWVGCAVQSALLNVGGINLDAGLTTHLFRNAKMIRVIVVLARPSAARKAA